MAATIEQAIPSAARTLEDEISDDDRMHLHFALGKALEDAGRYEESFAAYDAGNRLRRADLAYDIATQTTYPGWGYMISKGATTVWELWNGDTAEPSMNSGTPFNAGTLVQYSLKGSPGPSKHSVKG